MRERGDISQKIRLLSSFLLCSHVHYVMRSVCLRHRLAHGFLDAATTVISPSLNQNPEL